MSSVNDAGGDRFGKSRRAGYAVSGEIVIGMVTTRVDGVADTLHQVVAELGRLRNSQDEIAYTLRQVTAELGRLRAVERQRADAYAEMIAATARNQMLLKHALSDAAKVEERAREQGRMEGYIEGEVRGRRLGFSAGYVASTRARLGRKRFGGGATHPGRE